MTKASKVKKAPAPRKSHGKHKAIVASLQQAVATMTRRVEVVEAERRGRHQARAELLAPTRALLKTTADTNGTAAGEILRAGLTPGDCALLIACLAEAGYRPEGEIPKRWAAIPGGAGEMIFHLGEPVAPKNQEPPPNAGTDPNTVAKIA